MYIDLGAKLHDEEFKVQEDLTVKQGLCKSLLMEINGNGQPVLGESKIKRFDLWLKLKLAEGLVKLESEEITLLKEAVLVFAPLAAGQLTNHLKQGALAPVPNGVQASPAQTAPPEAAK